MANARVTIELQENPKTQYVFDLTDVGFNRYEPNTDKEARGILGYPPTCQLPQWWIDNETTLMDTITIAGKVLHAIAITPANTESPSTAEPGTSPAISERQSHGPSDR